MKAGRRGRGFERLGAPGARSLALPAPRARELLLADAWRRAAGAALAARARALRVDRGILDVEVPERRWADALAEQLRDLASRTAALAPALAIRKLRVRLPDGTEAIPSSPIREVEKPGLGAGRPSRKAARTRVAAPKSPAPPGDVTLERLEELRERYLARSQRTRRGPA